MGETKIIRKGLVMPQDKYEAYIAFMNENNLWVHFSHKVSNGKKGQTYISDDNAQKADIPAYMQNVKIRVGDKELIAETLAPKAYVWNVQDPNAFKLDSKVGKSLGDVLTYLTQNPEAQKAAFEQVTDPAAQELLKKLLAT